MYNKIKGMAVRHTMFNAVVCGYTAIIVKKEDLAICLQKGTNCTTCHLSLHRYKTTIIHSLSTFKKFSPCLIRYRKEHTQQRAATENLSMITLRNRKNTSFFFRVLVVSNNRVWRSTINIIYTLTTVVFTGNINERNAKHRLCVYSER